MQHDANLDLDPTSLSPRHQAIFALGVSGGDGDAPAGDAPTPAEGEAAVPAADAADAPVDEVTEPEEGAIPTVPEDLTVLDVEALQALHAELGDARSGLHDGARTPGDLDTIRGLTAGRDAIAAELQRRIDEDRQVAEQLSTLDEELRNEAPLPEPAGALASVNPRRPSAAQVAAARGAQTASAQQPPVPARPARRSPLLAAVGGDRTSVGDEMSLASLGEALDRTKRGNARTVVASLQPFDEMGDLGEELLGDGSTLRNSQLIREAREQWRAERRGEPRTAAICTPLDVLRDIPDGFNTTEPVSSMFPSRAAARLGFQYLVSIGLADMNGSVNQWDDEDQAGVDPADLDTWKECLDVECPSPASITAEAIVACLTWDITTEMSNPEHIANVLNALNSLRARIKEAKVLTTIDSLSHRYHYAGEYGAAPTLIAALNTAMAQATYADRLDGQTYDVILPPGLVQLLVIDLASRGYDSDTVTDALKYVKDRVEGVGNVVSSLDAASGEPGIPFTALNPVGHSSIALPSLSSLNSGQHRVRLIDPGSALYSETGQLNVGTTRDSQLLRQNKTQYFAEEFLFLAKQGPEPWFSIDLTLCADGSRAGLLEPAGCTS